MSKYVLDTHTLLWWLAKDPQLPATTRLDLQAAEELYVSVASLVDSYYLTTKSNPPLTFAEWRAMVRLLSDWPKNVTPLYVVMIDSPVAVLAVQAHRDAGIRCPWDRFIAATAAVLGYPLVTKDRELTKLAGSAPQWNPLQVSWR